MELGARASGIRGPLDQPSDLVPGGNDELPAYETGEALVVMEGSAAAHVDGLAHAGAGEVHQGGGTAARQVQIGLGRVNDANEAGGAAHVEPGEIGRASCRER